jgi:hypothetical protein
MVPSADSGSHLPFGLPPIFPELSEQLESYLTKPERIPIHNSEKAVRSVPWGQFFYWGLGENFLLHMQRLDANRANPNMG